MYVLYAYARNQLLLKVENGGKMAKKKHKSFFGWNYTVLIIFLVLFVIFVPTVLYLFEWENYTQDKQRAIKEIQINIDEKINSVKGVLNYTFFDAEFQQLLNETFTEGTSDTTKIYERLTLNTLIGDTVKNLVYFPLINQTLSADKYVTSTDVLMRYVYDILQVVKTEYFKESYFNGEYFAFTLPTEFNENEPESFLIGHWVLSASMQNYLDPVGVCIAVINLPALTDSFSLVSGDSIKVGLYSSDGKVIYGERVVNESLLENMNVSKMVVSSNYFGLKSILYFDVFQVFYNFLPYIFTIVLILLFLLVIFFLYLRVEEKRKTVVYDNFISTFRRISEGNVNDRVDKYNIEELDLVGKQFNLMMDSVLMLNKKLSEEELKAHHNEKEKDRYILKYLSTQINKHFIFNTFGVIRSFVNRGKNDEASECIDYLCNYLRFTFKGKDFVSVAEEIRSLSDYLNIQRIRLADIKVSVHVDEQIKDMQIPQFILQPIVENAYKHAFERNKGNIFVECKLNGNMIEFLVIDDGIGIESERLQQLNKILSANAETSADGEIGLINVQRRVKILTGDSACVKVESCLGKGTKVKILCGKRMENNA